MALRRRPPKSKHSRTREKLTPLHIEPKEAVERRVTMIRLLARRLDRNAILYTMHQKFGMTIGASEELIKSIRAEQEGSAAERRRTARRDQLERLYGTLPELYDTEKFSDAVRFEREIARIEGTYAPAEVRIGAEMTISARMLEVIRASDEKELAKMVEVAAERRLRAVGEDE